MLAAFISSGVDPKIISGDSPETVAALACQAGFDHARLVSGLELEAMEAAAFETAAVTGDHIRPDYSPSERAIW